MRLRFLIGFFLAGILGLPALSVVAQDAEPTVPPGVTIHVVQRGETLSQIAESLGTTTGTLVRLNNIVDESSISVGQRLLVPVAGTTPGGAPSIMHVVQPGETVESIAQLYGLTAEELSARNNLTDPASFYVGLLLDVSRILSPEPTIVPPTEGVVETSPTEIPTAEGSLTVPETVVMHIVLRGQTLFRIAQQYGVTVNDIARANQIADPTLIYTGQELIIPGLQAPQVDASVDMPGPARSIEIIPLVFTEGETGRIQLVTDNPMTVSGTFIDQTLHDAINENPLEHVLIIGIPVGTAVGIYPLNLVLTDGAGTATPMSMNIQIVSGNYRRESITLLADRANLLNPEMEDAELTRLRTTTSVFTPTRYFDGPMGLPAAAPLSSPFGSTRSYNGGEFSRVHTGTDFAAANGTPILAPAAGRVVLVDRFDVRGNVTIIDHGWGVFTVYCHQTEQYVSVGDMVTARQVIGITGSTGRVTGAHLHWELWVDGVAVDAMQWVQESFN
jgi:murein DD-endopeptidase MepM/ murein hydrolase activator NlpD